MQVRLIRRFVAGLAVAAAAAAQAAGTVGNTFPAGFPVIEDASLKRPVIGFGAASPVARTPVIFLHGNNDTPFPTACNPTYGHIQRLAQYLADNGYATSELWSLGYQGDRCDVNADQTERSRIAHTNQANVPDLRRFVRAVMAYTGAAQVDIVGHSLGVTLAREWIRQDGARHLVRRFVAIDGPNHGIINCSPDPANYWQLPAWAPSRLPVSCARNSVHRTRPSCACSTVRAEATRRWARCARSSSAMPTRVSSTSRCRTASSRRYRPSTRSASRPISRGAPA
ncbi:MAG: alpha/beta fold hydrolase [Rubrivivax sp.]|nr:alpha/beta fold hydrolase [Rubrivivax sp.]